MPLPYFLKCLGTGLCNFDGRFTFISSSNSLTYLLDVSKNPKYSFSIHFLAYILSIFSNLTIDFSINSSIVIDL